MHLTSELALDLIEGRIAFAELEPWTTHLDKCSTCSHHLRDWRRVHLRLGGSHLVSAPEEVLEHARAIFATEVKRPIFRELVAAIVFDSFAQPALEGARGATDARQMVLRAEELDIHLKISTNPSLKQIIGQVFVRNETAFVSSVRLHLLHDKKPFKSTWSDNFGGFQFDDVLPGVFHLQVDLPYLTVVGGISIGENPSQSNQG
jgi:hypothetical protein